MSERRNIQFSHLQKKSRVKMRIVKLSEVFIFGLRPNQSKIAWSEFLFICFSSFLSIYIVVKAYQVKFMTLDFGCVQFRNMHSHYCKIDFWNFLLLQNWNSRAIEHEFPLLQLLAIMSDFTEDWITDVPCAWHHFSQSAFSIDPTEGCLLSHLWGPAFVWAAITKIS